ncbi:hypothetical protein DF022_22015 [Burkholderia cepacia]|nr:hypothetical protein DF023_20190 [Burkholderia cepacia]RQU01251.1 hypothetical protein DF022_22015 [Burkholderia cepacia]RQZ78436.1 hypothetical protein DF056_22380 [Burkholderia cepacia]
MPARATPVRSTRDAVTSGVVPPNSDTDTLKPIASACVLAIRGTTGGRGSPWYLVKSIVPIAARPATFTITSLPSVAIRPSLKKRSRSARGIDEKKRAAARHARKLGDRSAVASQLPFDATVLAAPVQSF